MSMWVWVCGYECLFCVHLGLCGFGCAAMTILWVCVGLCVWLCLCVHVELWVWVCGYECILCAHGSVWVWVCGYDYFVGLCGFGCVAMTILWVSVGLGVWL